MATFSIWGEKNRMTEYYQVWLSSESKEDAKVILDRLTHSKLIVGGSLFTAPSHFWWKGEELDMEGYTYVMGFTTSDKREEFEAEYENLSTEEIPMVSFIKMDGNQKFLEYIFENTRDQQ